MALECKAAKAGADRDGVEREGCRWLQALRSDDVDNLKGKRGRAGGKKEF
jgi:hypothetical protein